MGHIRKCIGHLGPFVRDECLRVFKAFPVTSSKEFTTDHELVSPHGIVAVLQIGRSLFRILVVSREHINHFDHKVCIRTTDGCLQLYLDRTGQRERVFQYR